MAGQLARRPAQQPGAVVCAAAACNSRARAGAKASARVPADLSLARHDASRGPPAVAAPFCAPAVPALAGRSGLEAYRGLLRSFRCEFAHLLGSTITDVLIGAPVWPLRTYMYRLVTTHITLHHGQPVGLICAVWAHVARQWLPRASGRRPCRDAQALRPVVLAARSPCGGAWAAGQGAEPAVLPPAARGAGLGPDGELKYPAHPRDGRWAFPGLGEPQVGLERGPGIYSGQRPAAIWPGLGALSHAREGEGWLTRRRGGLLRDSVREPYVKRTLPVLRRAGVRPLHAVGAARGGAAGVAAQLGPRRAARRGRIPLRPQHHGLLRAARQLE